MPHASDYKTCSWCNKNVHHVAHHICHDCQDAIRGGQGRTSEQVESDGNALLGIFVGLLIATACYGVVYFFFFR